MFSVWRDKGVGFGVWDWSLGVMMVFWCGVACSLEGSEGEVEGLTGGVD